jgi:transcriptional regulator with XRE-family HTH domain
MVAIMMNMTDGIGERLRESRKKAGLTQLEVAKACDVTPGAISNLERGDSHTMASEHLFAAAKVLRVDPEWLATGKGSSKGRPLLMHLSPEATLMADQIDRLPDDQRAIVMALIQQLSR